MSRHNRRIHRSQKAARPRENFEIPTHLPNDAIRPRAPTLHACVRSGDITAKHWHNRYIAWQNRERRQREERQRLIEDRYRIFGGENDGIDEDEDDLCLKMLDYFNRLDYMDVDH